MISVRHFRHQWKVRIQAPLPAYLNHPNPMFFIGTLSQTLTLRAAFASSTYLLRKYPNPAGRLKTCLNLPNPLFKGAHQGLRAFHRRDAIPARQLRPGI